MEVQQSIADTAVAAAAAAAMHAYQQLLGSIKRASYVVKRWVSASGARWGQPNASVPAIYVGDDIDGDDNDGDDSGDGVDGQSGLPVAAMAVAAASFHTVHIKHARAINHAYCPHHLGAIQHHHPAHCSSACTWRDAPAAPCMMPARRRGGCTRWTRRCATIGRAEASVNEADVKMRRVECRRMSAQQS